MLCEDEDIAQENLGSTKLQDRLADIFAATTVHDLLVGSPEEVEYESLPAFKVDIDEGFTLFFSPNHIKIPYLENGKIDWNNVYRVKVIAIQKK